MKISSTVWKIIVAGGLLVVCIYGYGLDLSESIRLKTIHQNLFIVLLVPILLMLFIVMIVRWIQAEKDG